MSPLNAHQPLQGFSMRCNPPLDVVDLVAELASLTEQLDSRLHPDAAASLADMVRIMNCYYSKGHNTIHRDIERALVNELDHDQSRRNLQIEARTHIRVQKLIDEMHAQHALPEPASSDFLQWLHTEFYRDASDEMLVIKQGKQDFKMVPGEFRSLTVHDVAVGRHLPPSSETELKSLRGEYNRLKPIFEASSGFRRPRNLENGYRNRRCGGEFQQPARCNPRLFGYTQCEATTRFY